jgi:hypothetical protein
MLDPEDWKIVFEIYKGDPILALGLAQQLTAIRQSLESGRIATRRLATSEETEPFWH